jgi:predicted TIM-barrel fold metal-dependent hydrolase
VRLSPSAGADGDWIAGPLMPPLWKRCAQLKVPMTLLVPVTRLPQLHPLIEANPDLQVVIDHMADSPLDHPEQLEMLLALEKYPKVFVKISHMWSLSKQAYPYADAAVQVKRLYDVFGANRLMAGTDWPISLPKQSYAQTVALWREHMDFLPKDSPAVTTYISDTGQTNLNEPYPLGPHDWLLHGTVQRVWPFGV